MMRGFTQTFHFWKESRRAGCVPLHSYLTYISLPWYLIIKGELYTLTPQKRKGLGTCHLEEILQLVFSLNFGQMQM